MSIKSAPYYWLECDGPDCKATTADLGEYTAWADSGYAEEEAANCDWITRGDKHYCSTHAKAFRCPNCGEEIEDPAVGCPDPECMAETSEAGSAS
jgi:predicted RNA-binding Zn-ribbon protein involved in translation (DUF1610 family)